MVCVTRNLQNTKENKDKKPDERTGNFVNGLMQGTHVYNAFREGKYRKVIQEFENDNTNKLEGFTFCSVIKLLHLKAAIAVFPHPGGDITTILFEEFSSIISFCSLEGTNIDEASFLIFQIF